MGRPITIAGGGLSGLATAVLLASRGMEVEVFDRRVGGGGRFHDGWQIIENGSCEQDALEELEAEGFPLAEDVVPAARAVFLDGLGGIHEVGSAHPYAYFTRRGKGEGSLDTRLRRMALEAGVALREGVAAPDAVDVVATGPWQADGAARETVFTSDLPDTIAVLFDPEVTPTGYAYLFCLAGHGTFGVAQVRGTAGLREGHRRAWERFREVFGAFAVRNEHTGGQFMNFCLPRTLCGGDGCWYVGEAAGVQDFLFGLGNRLAFRSAALVAEGIGASWDGARFRTGLLRPMRHSIVLRFVYERLRRPGFARFCRQAAGRDLRRFLIALQRPRLASRVVAAVLMATWRRRGGCRHTPLCSWCREGER